MQPNIENIDNGPIKSNKHEIDKHSNLSAGGTISAYDKYLVDINAQKPSFSLAICTLNTFQHTKRLKKILLALAILCVTFTELKADFKSFPIMQEFKYITSEDNAIDRLFHDQVYTVSKITRTSIQAKNIYAVTTSEKKWFVKIIRDDCYLCSSTSFDYEWELKYAQNKHDLLKTVNAEMIVPNESASFFLRNKNHIIVSYPWAPGKTLQEIYTEHYLGNRTSQTLNKAMYRYGQVLATTHLDQNEPEDNMDRLLERAPRISLDDRHGGNTKYFESDDKIYLLDLSTIHTNMDPDTVGKSIISTISDICELLAHFLKSEDYQSSIHADSPQEILTHGREYVISTLNQFIAGYISASPNYNPNVIKSMFRQQITAVFKDFCAIGSCQLFCNIIHNMHLLKSLQETNILDIMIQLPLHLGAVPPYPSVAKCRSPENSEHCSALRLDDEYTYTP
ncbi:MAG: hypothetical protein QS721_08175 [Candidatus Endonucleobacter sp. (ex Gigantidas childressi)]|nr:hypothetical protein [Candidatus Endonucleobacter sp. (ex Gigantidas childressi)]